MRRRRLGRGCGRVVAAAATADERQGGQGNHRRAGEKGDGSDANHGRHFVEGEKGSPGCASRPERWAPAPAPRPASCNGNKAGAYLFVFVALFSVSVRRRELWAIWPDAPVEATATTLSWRLLPASRWLPFASFTFSVFEAPGARLYRELPSWTATFSPASLMALAVPSVSLPVELPDAPAGALTLINATPRFTITLPPPIVTGCVAVWTGPGVALGVRSTVSKPSRMSSCPTSATTESLPAPPRARSAVLSRMSTWSSPSSAKTTSMPPPGLIASFPEPPRNVSDE